MHYLSNNLPNSVFSRRAFILVILKCVIFLVIAVRLFFLQVIKSSEYKALSDRNRIKLLLLEPPRGLILDRNDVVLAQNKVSHQLYFYKQRDQDFTSILQEIFKTLNMSDEERNTVKESVENASYVYPILITESLSWNQVATIESNLHKLPGVYIENGYLRHYPLAECCAHVVGYVGAPTANHLKQHRLFYNKAFKVGRAGVEKTFDQICLGKFGSRKVEINAHRIVVRELSRETSTPGENIKLSIDSKLQKFVFDKIPKEGGVAIVTDIDTGEVLSMVSTPTFDPNIFSTSISKRQWQAMLNRDSYPLANKAISKLYPPGSAWKIVVGLAILRAGIDPRRKIHCSGSIMVGNRAFKCWKEAGHGDVDFHGAFVGSCNCYFYALAPVAGIENIHYTAEMLGFGSKSKIELPGELEGSNPNKLWKQRMFGEEWKAYDTINACIGQGYTLVTPMQTVTMMMRILKATSITPTVILNGNANVSNTSLNIPAEHLQMVRAALIGAVNLSHGTAYPSRIKEEMYAWGGKTGTAQVISQDTLNTRNRSIKSHSHCVAFAPIHKPKFAISVTVDHGGWGSAAAAPLARDILYFTQKA